MTATVIAFPADRVRRSVECLERPTTPRPTDANTEEFFTDLQVAEWCKAQGWEHLTPNQREFIDTICISLRHRPLTDRQRDWLEGIVQKLNNRLFPDGGDAA